MASSNTRYHQRTNSYPQRPSSISSESSVSSQVTTVSSSRPSPYPHQNAQASASTSSIPASNRGNNLRPNGTEPPMRQPSPLGMAPMQADRRRHPQGFFEPTLPTASHHNVSNLDASQIAARAAMHLQGPRQEARRAQTLQDTSTFGRRNASGPPPIYTGQSSASSSRTNSLVDDKMAATTAASAAYPRSPNQVTLPHFGLGERVASPVSREEVKPVKEKSRMKLFHKPKAIQTSRNADKQAVSSPKNSIYPTGPMVGSKVNQSTTSLAESVMSGASSFYSMANASTSTLTPTERGSSEKEKHRHHFLSRQKNKDHHNLPLSSASSNSRATDPAAPQPLYSFTPSSPGPGSKSISGLDLRHGGRALREKKKEEKAAAAAVANTFVPNVGSAASMSEPAHPGMGFDWTASNIGAVNVTPGTASDFGVPTAALGGFGLQGMSVDDAWPLLKARLLNIFEGEDLRTPIEDFNRLVTAHLQRCIARRSPSVIVEDVRELLQTGFASLDMTLRGVPDDRLVPYLVDMWATTFGTILPFMQAVFLPLDLEFHGKGTLLSSRDAADFWATGLRSGLAGASGSAIPSLDVRTLVLATFRDVIILPRHDALLATFSRLSLDSIHAPPLMPLSPPSLMASHRPGTAGSGSGSLDPAMASYTSNGSTLLDTTSSLGARSRATSNTSASSFHSVNSTRPRHGTVSSAGAGSAASGGLSRGHAHDVPIDSALVTQTAARMLQCISVLAGLGATQMADSRDGASSVASNSTVHGASAGSVSTSSGSFEQQRRARAPTLSETTADEHAVARRKMERLARELKLNWLGRGRTGRNRRGLVGSKAVARPTVAMAGGIGVGA